MLKTYTLLAALLLILLSRLVAISTATEGASPAESAQWVPVTSDAYQGDLGAGFAAEKLRISAVFTDRTTGNAYLLGWGHGVLSTCPETIPCFSDAGVWCSSIVSRLRGG